MYTQKSMFHLAVRLLVSLVASHFIVVQNTSETWLQLFTKGYYYLSVIYSMIIAFLLIEFVYFQAKQVNKHFPGSYLSISQVKKQIIYGFLGAALLAFVLAAILFWVNGQSIFESSYFENVFPYILVFILCLNFIYLLYFRNLNLPKMRYIIVDPEHDKLRFLRAISIEENWPAIIYFKNRGYFSSDFNGVKSVWPYTIEESIRILNRDDYCQINKKEIINRAAILSTKSYPPICKIELSIPHESTLYTSRRKTKPFKRWLDNDAN